MSKKSSNNNLLQKEMKQLVKVLNNYIDWLSEIGVLKNATKITKTVDFPFSTQDWFMQVSDNSISFNTIITGRCTFEYYQMVVLHEAFHLMVQKIPNKSDATRIRDGFGDQLMKLIDIEADFYTALYYKEKLNYSLIEYLGLYFDGRTVFNDERIRPVKFERYIGSLLSVAKLFIEYPKKGKQKMNYDLYLPTITPVYTESRLHVLVVRKEHICLEEIQATHEDFVKLMGCYKDVHTYAKRGYIDTLIAFIYSAFKKEIPNEIKNEIKQIRS